MTHTLLASVPEIGGAVLECCSGGAAIASVLQASGLSVVTNDRRGSLPADFHLDAARASSWRAFPVVDWVVSNPPYSGHLCLPIVRAAVAHARVGVAMLLRISFKEPTGTGTRRRRLATGRIVPASEPRGPWLAAHPMARELVLPRWSFTGTGTDSATVAWMIWSQVPLSGPAHLSIYPHPSAA